MKDDLYLPDDLLYSKNHLWVKKDGEEIIVGIDDYAQNQLGEVLYVDFPEVDACFNSGDEFGSVESVKSVSPLVMPVDGRVTATNRGLEDLPALVNSDCYGDAWIIRLVPDDVNDLKNLANAEYYKKSLD